MIYILQAVDKYYNGISPNHWLPWIPQLLTCLVRQEGSHILNLLCSVGKAYPQAVYFPIRTLYLTLKMEQREKGEWDAVRGVLDRLISAIVGVLFLSSSLPSLPPSLPHPLPLPQSRQICR